MKTTTPRLPDASPVEVAAAVYAALRDRDWPRLLALVDPTAAEDFKREQHGFAAMALHVAQLPREESQVADSTEAAEASPEPSLLRHVFRVKNLDEFDALAAGEVVGRFMRVQYRRTPVAGPTNREDHVVLGIVHETPELAHAIVRTTFQIADEVAPDAAAFAFFTQGRRSWVDVLTLRRTSAGWRSHLNGGLITSGAGGFSIGYNHTDDEHPEASASRER